MLWTRWLCHIRYAKVGWPIAAADDENTPMNKVKKVKKGTANGGNKAAKFKANGGKPEAKPEATGGTPKAPFFTFERSRSHSMAKTGLCGDGSTQEFPIREGLQVCDREHCQG